MNKLSPIAFGLAFGIIWGAGVFLMVLMAMFLGHAKEIVDLLGKCYLGVSATWAGAFIGLLWAFADGFICGAVFAWLYNLFSR